ncbi:beta-N-acetylhexosaminidase [Enhydrobacter sp.]|jgi:beta-N-acetylhexosaminidase|uniref:beta-N-acetylhexosaminidase n=1 Tax=Enhydrobacter sp. TaxID=1894999 RepID=UPI00260D2030|nr:beta-N-acetylhexosaminidase [Enhydrobacter sp.]WIM12266.1 MAG: beta-N-acetylglucosaminidase [Enhydrobacter sp.]
MSPRAAIFGCSGLDLTSEERVFFRDADPLGFILFARNVDTPQQARRLVDELRTSVGRAEAPVLIDQEGGRVARLKPPHWRAAPPARLLGELYERDPERGLEATRLNSRLLAADVASIGCDVDCLPVLDIAVPETHAVIGDRAYGSDPGTVAALGRAAAEGLLAEGVMPIIKHIPGHGRAMVDSHHALPTVDAPLDVLERLDFLPFSLLSDLPWAMTAHVLYTAVDAEAALTVSARGVQNVVRRHIGFDGLLLSDDLSMQALGGSLGDRAARALLAGCDIALHCNGRMDEMREIADRAGPMTAATMRRFEEGRRYLARHRAPLGGAGLADAGKRLSSLLPGWG